MNKFDLAKRLARESHRSSGQAADEVDTLVYELLKDLKRTPAKPPDKAERVLKPARRTGLKGKP